MRETPNWPKRCKAVSDLMRKHGGRMTVSQIGKHLHMGHSVIAETLRRIGAKPDDRRIPLWTLPETAFLEPAPPHGYTWASAVEAVLRAQRSM